MSFVSRFNTARLQNIEAWTVEAPRYLQYDASNLERFDLQTWTTQAEAETLRMNGRIAIDHRFENNKPKSPVI